MRGHFVALVLAGCSFNSAVDLPTDASRDASGLMLDALGTGTDASIAPPTCYGPAAPSSFQVCIDAPTGVVMLPAVIDTTPGMQPLCLQAQPVGWSPRQPAACFIVANTIMVGNTSVTGVRPLVLVAAGDITIVGSLDVASHLDGGKRGPGLTGEGCEPFPKNPANSVSGAGGGAGGSFTTPGGDGGIGDNKKGTGGIASAGDASPRNRLRGGCEAQTGGSGEQLAGVAGAGGGAVYLVAGGAIRNTGVINASGAGGEGGGDRSGGSGGGSGGMIVLHAPVIENQSGTVMANGGGGAGGGSKNASGNSGSDPDPDEPTTAASGGAGTGGVGGTGYADGTDAAPGGDGAKDRGGGGGGGGAGYIRTNISITGQKSPDPQVIL